MSADRLQRGALYMMAAALLFAAMAAIVKTVAQSLPNEMVVFFRSLFGLLALTPWLAHRGRRAVVTRRWRSHLVRGLAGLAAMYCYFYAIAHLRLAEATLLNYTTPLFVPLIAAAWLNEAVPRRLWGMLLLGFAGVALILKPGLALFQPAALIGLASGVLAAVAMVGIRSLSRTEPATRIVFYFSLISTAISAVPLAWSWQSPAVDWWGLLIAVGALATAAQILMTRAYGCAPAAQVGPFAYSIVLFAAVLGWGLWGEVPDALSLAGAALVCAAGVLTIRRAGRLAPPAELPATK
jgi:drug/metabolite transporter (DMT)-like permease